MPEAALSKLSLVNRMVCGSRLSFPIPNAAAVLAIMPIAIATIPESTAHIYQIDIYVNDLAKKGSKKKYDLACLLDRNLIGDGICDMISGVGKGLQEQTTARISSTMAITKVFNSGTCRSFCYCNGHFFLHTAYPSDLRHSDGGDRRSRNVSVRCYRSHRVLPS